MKKEKVPVKTLREDAGITQQELSDLTGIPRGRINAWEQRGSMPRADDYEAIVSALNKSDTNVSKPEGNKLKQLVNQIQFEKKWSIEDVARSINYSRVHLNKAMNRSQDDENTDALVEQLKNKFQEITPKHEAPANAFNTIADSLMIMAKRGLVDAETQSKSMDTILQLTGMVKEKSTVDAFEGIPVALLPKFSGLLELIADAGTKGWKSRPEALAELSRQFYGSAKKGSKRGILDGEGK